MSNHPDHADKMSPVPAEYAGKWLAYDHGKTRILAAERTFAAALAAAEQAGEKQPVFVKMPLADVRVVR